ncbi:MAG: hypothetical protein U0526_01490 [Candidatus Saccharibacteria bacterium]
MRRLTWLLLIAGLALVPMQSRAADESLRVLPLRTRPVITPGETKADKLEIRNSGTRPLTIRLSAEQFAVTNEQYDYRFEQGEKTDWVRFSEPELVLGPGEQREAAYSIAIPNNASPGGYYFALFVAGEPAENSDVIREVKRVASLVYLEVAGEIKRSGKVLGVEMVGLSLDRSVNYDLRLINQGNSHYDVDTRLKLQNVLTRQELSTQLTGLLLPGTIRTLSKQFELPPWPGLYQVAGQASFPGMVQAVPTRYVVYLPVWAMLGLVGVIILLGVLIYRRRHRGIKARSLR